MTRGPNNTAPMGLVVDPDRTDPGEPPAAATNADTTEPGAWSPDVTPVTPSAKPLENGTDPGLDPMLKAFNRPPRPPAPQPNLRPSSDGEEFAAHYASPRELRAPQVLPTAHDPAVLIQLAQLARTDTAPMADPTPDAALAVQRDLQTVFLPGRRRIPVRTLTIALACGAVIAAFGAVLFFFFFGAAKSTPATSSAGTGSMSTHSPVPPSASPPPSGTPSSSVPSVAVTTTASTAVPPSPAPPAVRSAQPAAAPVVAPPTTRPTSTSSPRPATSEHVKPPVPARPAHETPDTVL